MIDCMYVTTMHFLLKTIFHPFNHVAWCSYISLFLDKSLNLVCAGFCSNMSESIILYNYGYRDLDLGFDWLAILVSVMDMTCI